MIEYFKDELSRFVLFGVLIASCGGQAAVSSSGDLNDESSETVAALENRGSESSGEPIDTSEKQMSVLSQNSDATDAERDSSGDAKGEMRTRGLKLKQDRPVRIQPLANQFMTMQVWAQRGSEQPFPIDRGEQLKTGDKVYLSVKSDQDAYIYVSYIQSEGQPELIYPLNGTHKIAAGRESRIPHEGSSFEITSNEASNVERFVVVASKNPVDDFSKTLEGAVEQAKGASVDSPDTESDNSTHQADSKRAGAKSTSRTKSKRLGKNAKTGASNSTSKYRHAMRYRGIALVEDERPKDEAIPSSNDVAVIEFWIKHEADRD
jgi:hypothetical protein